MGEQGRFHDTCDAMIGTGAMKPRITECRMGLKAYLLLCCQDLGLDLWIVGPIVLGGQGVQQGVAPLVCGSIALRGF